MTPVLKAGEYVVASRRIAGTHDEELDQIDEAIQELLDLKLLECAADEPNLRVNVLLLNLDLDGRYKSAKR